MKTRKMKRFATIAAIAMIASCMAAPMSTVFAAQVNDPPTNGSMEDVQAHTYTAYQIFTGEKTDAGLTVTGWGTGINSATLVVDNEFRTLIGLEAYQDGDDLETADVIAQKIDTIASLSAEADKLAAILEKYKGTGEAFTKDADTGVYKSNLSVGYYLITDTYVDGTAGDAMSKFILKVEDGTGVTINPKKSYPTVEKKVEENKTIPNMEYRGDVNFNDVADYNIGEAISFKLYANIPALDGYESYYIKFTDTLGAEFDVVSDAKDFVIKVGNTVVAPNDWNIHIDINEDTNVITVEIEDIFALVNANDSNDKLVDAAVGATITVEYEAELNETAKIGLPGQINQVDLTYSNNPNEVYAPKTDGPTGTDYDGDGNKDVNEDTDGDGRLDVDEDTDGDGKLDEKEDIDGDGNLDVDEDTNGNGELDEGEDIDGDNNLDVDEDVDNDGRLDVDEDIDDDGKLDEDEDKDGDGDLDTRPDDDTNDKPVGQDQTGPDKVIVFTYALDTTKIDALDPDTELAGAKFKLANAETSGQYALLDKDGTGNYVFKGWAAAGGAGTEIDTATAKSFKIVGLDEGTYYLEETAAPEGYNKLEERVKVVLEADTLDATIKDDEDKDVLAATRRQDWKWGEERQDAQGTKALFDLTVTANDVAGTVDAAKGTGSITIGNRKGLQLPGTGGIGTTIFYVVGGTMAAGAGVYLISKKRMKKDEE